VRHHAGQLRFVVGGLDHAAVDVDVPAGQGESVDPPVVDGLEGVGKLLAGRMRREPLAQLVQVVVHPRVVQHEHLPRDFGKPARPTRRPAAAENMFQPGFSAVRPAPVGDRVPGLASARLPACHRARSIAAAPPETETAGSSRRCCRRSGPAPPSEGRPARNVQRLAQPRDDERVPSLPASKRHCWLERPSKRVARTGVLLLVPTASSAFPFIAFRKE
jgi:hypothetical protein